MGPALPAPSVCGTNQAACRRHQTLIFVLRKAIPELRRREAIVERVSPSPALCIGGCERAGSALVSALKGARTTTGPIIDRIAIQQSMRTGAALGGLPAARIRRTQGDSTCATRQLVMSGISPRSSTTCPNAPTGGPVYQRAQYEVTVKLPGKLSHSRRLRKQRNRVPRLWGGKRVFLKSGR